ncbi:MAG: GTPase ObgE, partial [Ignavibacteriaceae bacterium]|nr:GTPase ObgE [Ignavibacteriaceae bacterium]
YQQDYKVLLNELKSYSPKLAQKRKLVALTKSDLLTEDEIKKLKKKKIRGTETSFLVISSAAHHGLQELLDKLWEIIQIEE